MTQTLEDVQEIVIDKWGSLNTAASPQRLPDGHSPDNSNVWMDEKAGSLVTANGNLLLGTNPSGNPTTFLVNYFKTSDGTQTVVLSDGQTVWKTTNYVDFTSIKTGLSEFFQLRGMVIRDKLWLTNGSDPVMTYDGTTLTELDGTGGTPDVPIAKYISYHDERVWLYGINGDPSSLVFSSLTDATGTEVAPDSADAWAGVADNELQISEGDADIGTGLFLFRGYLHASKSFSIWRIVGYDEYSYTRVKTRSSTGTRFQESVQVLDNLVHFIGVDGFYTFDGEESKRISDIIDPATTEAGVFSFRNLQQPLLNNNFQNVSSSAEFAAGTVPNNLSTANDMLKLAAAADSEAEFTAGVTQTNVSVTEEPGSVKLGRQSSGGSSEAATRIGGILDDAANNAIFYGTATSLFDNSTSTTAGIGVRAFSTNRILVTFDTPTAIGRIILRNVQADTNEAFSVQVNTGTAQTQYGNQGTWVTVGAGTWAPSGAWTSQEVSVDFATQTAIQVSIFWAANGGSYIVGEIEAYKTAYQLTGQFISRSIDFSAIPASFGALAATVTAPASTTSEFFTQSSADGSTWDAAVVVANGAAITSTLRRYLRWGVNFTSDGGLSPVVSVVFVGGTYLSQIFNTGGGILQWGALQIVQSKAGQTINAYYRAGASFAAVSAASWTAIVPGAVPGSAATDTFIQLRLEFSTVDPILIPSVSSFTFNWTIGTAGGVNTLQNVASITILNRYWLSAATLEATENDVVIVRGKATAGGPWHKKDFSYLSFARYQDYYIAGSSVDGSIYRLEYGYSKDGDEMDSYFETADFSKSGFFLQLYEILVSLDRLGPYDLSVGISTDGGISYTEKTIDLTRDSLTQSLSFTKKLNINVMCDSFRLRFRTNGADQPFSIDDARVFYRLLPSRGSLS